MTLEGKVAIVTGAAQGIGRAYATALAEDGAAVVVADLKRDGAAETVELIEKAGGEGLAVEVDVSDRDSTLAMAAAVRDRFGTAHILVNNAAIYESLQGGPILEYDIGYWRKVFAVNLEGPLLCTQAVAPMLIEAGWGRVVNQSSIGAYMGRGTHYACSKLALIGLTQGLARELGPHGITVNAIAPGTIHTDATMKVVPEALRNEMIGRAAIGIRAEPAELVGTLRYLVGDGAAFVTGQTIAVDGGAVPRL
jgi:3-oxoacyl-[acyl-carrier protein] reductase